MQRKGRGAYVTAEHDRSARFRVSPRLVLSTTSVFETYWRFAYERQEIFYRRLSGDPRPWTEDAILRAFRFTNVYRASDRVSQYLIRHVIYEGPQTTDEIFFRVFLFKIFQPHRDVGTSRRESSKANWATFDFGRYDQVLRRLMRRGERIYSAAYIVPPPTSGAPRKHWNHLLLVDHDDARSLPPRLAAARSFAPGVRTAARLSVARGLSSPFSSP